MAENDKKSPPAPGPAALPPPHLIKMHRTSPMHKGGPTTADVHPREVENWKLHGWAVKESR